MLHVSQGIDVVVAREQQVSNGAAECGGCRSCFSDTQSRKRHLKGGQICCSPRALPMSCAGGLCREEVCTGSWLQQECGKHTLAERPGEKRL